MKNILLTLLFLALTYWTYSIHHNVMTNHPETMRGSVPASAPADLTPEAYADGVVRSVEMLRNAGMEPARYLFELPEGWKPPSDWAPPSDWNPPSWWHD